MRHGLLEADGVAASAEIQGIVVCDKRVEYVHQYRFVLPQPVDLAIGDFRQAGQSGVWLLDLEIGKGPVFCKQDFACAPRHVLLGGCQ